MGRDTRISGPMLEGALVSGLASASTDIFSLGIVPSPITAWMVKETGSESGIEVTASHNPPEYNGLKIFNQRGMSLKEKEQEELETVINEELYYRSPWDAVGNVENLDSVGFYIDELMERIELEPNYRIVCDLFNGATCTVAPALMEEFAIQAIFINGLADGRLPSGNPEPDEKSLQRLSNFLKLKEVQVGFGFDGDGDRMMPVDNTGRVVSPDRALAAYAAYEVEKNQGGVVVTHVGASMSVNEVVEDAGGEVKRTPVGDVFITEAMAEYKAVFGGEPVGAWVHPGINMCPDGLLSALKLLEALQEKEMTLQEFVSQAPLYPIRREKLNCPNDKKAAVLEFISTNYGKAFGEVESVSTMDGVKLEMEEGWVLIRPSGTEPSVRLTVEAMSPQHVKEYTEKGITLIKKSLREVK